MFAKTKHVLEGVFLINFRPETTAKSKVHNQLQQDLEAYSIGFSIDLVQSIGNTVVDNFSDTLWYLDSHHEKCRDQHLVIPISFTKYQGFNDYRKNHKSKQHIQAVKLHTHIGSLVSILGMPWILKNKNSEFRRSL